MKGFLVDTTSSLSFRGEEAPDQRVKSWIGAALPGSLYVSVMTLAELRRGIELLPQGNRRNQLERWLENDLLEPFESANILPVTKAIGDRWAVLSAGAQQKGIQPSVIDGLIAATALEDDLGLVTRNIKDFEQLGVPLLNPWES